MLNSRQIRLLACMLVLSLGAIASSAGPLRVSAELVSRDVVVQDGVATAVFKVVVTNEETSPLGSVSVVFGPDLELEVGDVPAEGSGESGYVSRTFDVSQSPSKNVVVKVTLKFSAGGARVEQAATVVLAIDPSTSLPR